MIAALRDHVSRAPPCAASSSSSSVAADVCGVRRDVPSACLSSGAAALNRWIPLTTHRSAPRRDPSSRRSLLHPERSGNHRRRLRCAAEGAGGARGRAPGSRHAGLADAARRRAAGRGLRDGRASAADAQPRQRLQRGRAARVRRAGAQGRRPRRRASRLRRRAEDRRPQHRAHLRRRRAGARRDPRRRRPRRGRHVERPRHPRDAAAAATAARPGRSRCAARSTCRGVVRARQPRARGRRTKLPSPTRATPPPARCGPSTRRWWRAAGSGAYVYQLVVPGERERCAPLGDARGAARAGGCPSSRTGRAATGSTRCSSSATRWQDTPPLARVRHRRRRRSRSTTWRCASDWGRPPSFRGGRWRSSSRRSRRRRRSCRSGSTSAGPARSRRMPSSSRSSSPARRSRWRRCTTPRTSRARTCAKATRVLIEKARRRHPEGRQGDRRARAGQRRRG